MALAKSKLVLPHPPALSRERLTTRNDFRRLAGPDSLAVALQEFQDGLAPDKKSDLLASKSVPDANAVLAFTAQLDSANAERGRRGVASCFCKFLPSVQQYSAVMDTYSQVKADTTSLIWGSLKLTIHVASGIAVYFDKLSEWFMKLGSICPRFSEYQGLFSHCVRLQKALEAFYATVVRFCGRALQVMERSGFGHFIASLWKPFELEFAAFESELMRLNIEVMEEIRLAALHTASDYQAGGLSFRKSMTRWRDKDNARNMLIDEYRSRTRKQQLLEQLSKHDYYRALYRSRKQRHAATCAWIAHEEAYRQWLEKNEASVFWLSGGIGCGKTIITSAVIDDLLCRRSSSEKAFISFFFCADNDAGSLQATVILGSLLRACLTVETLTRDVEDAVSQLFSKRSFINATELRELFIKVSSLAATHFIVIDGFDECPKSERTAVLTVLRDVFAQARSRVKLFFSCRDDIGDEIQRAFPAFHRQSMSPTLVSRDIAAFVEDELKAKIADRELAFGDPALPTDIRDALVRGADGMFLWVVLQLFAICEQTCDVGIRKVIGALPRGLGETYAKALSRVVDRGKADFAQSVYRWVAAARRPLTLDELREVLHIEPGQASFRHDRLVNNIDQLVPWCGNLVTVDEDDGAVQFVHHTAKQFLCSAPGDGNGVAHAGGVGADFGTVSPFRIALDEADHNIGGTCVTHLNFSDFERQLVKEADPAALAGAVSPTRLAGASLADNLKPGVAASVSGFLASIPLRQRRRSAEVDIMPRLGAVSNRPTTPVHQQFAFLAYAQAYWLHHTTNFSRTKSHTWHLWLNLLRKESFAAVLESGQRLSDDASDLGEFGPLVDCIVQHEHRALFERLLDLHNSSVSAFRPWEATVLERIAEAGAEKVLHILLRRECANYISHSRAINLASEHGHIGVVRYLLALADNVYYGKGVRDARFTAALRAAAGGGHSELVHLLLRTGADVVFYCYETLELAAARGDVSIVDMLLVGFSRPKSVADASIKADDILLFRVCDALLDAAAAGRADEAKELLEILPPHITKHAFRHDGCRSISAAAAGGHLAVVEHLLAAGAPVRPRNGDEETYPMHRAAKGGHVAVVMRLLEAGANPYKCSKHHGGMTVFEIAARNGHVELVELLRIATDEMPVRSRSRS